MFRPALEAGRNITRGYGLKENSMKNKHGLLFGFAVIAMAAIFTLAGCEDDTTDVDTNTVGSVPSGTIKLVQSDEQKEVNKFDIVLTGLTWSDTVTEADQCRYRLPGLFEISEPAESDLLIGYGGIHFDASSSDLNKAKLDVTKTILTVRARNMNVDGTGKLKLKDMSKTLAGTDVNPESESFAENTDIGASEVFVMTNEFNLAKWKEFNGKLTVANDSAEVEFDSAKENDGWVE
jgi:hypothetical protein